MPEEEAADYGRLLINWDKGDRRVRLVNGTHSWRTQRYDSQFLGDANVLVSRAQNVVTVNCYRSVDWSYDCHGKNVPSYGDRGEALAESRSPSADRE